MRATAEHLRGLAAALLALSAVFACVPHDSSATPPPPPPPEPTDLAPDADPPGLRASIVAVEGASGLDGTFQVGDRVALRFTLTKADGSPWGLAEMTESSVLFSGPTFNHQRVLAEQRDVVERAVANPDGSFTYAFAARVPERYLAPYNDTPAFGPGDGELAGTPLLAGTYTLGLAFAWRYSVGGADFVDVGETTADVILGGASTLQPREVTTGANCDRCHVSLRAHGGLRRDVRLCVLCHTSGAEDLNDPAVAGGTPGRSIDLRVIMHKLHNGRHLPSVNGVGCDASGRVVYGLAARPYVLADSVTGAHDYSNVGFPVWPNRGLPMPRDFGYSALPAVARATEDRIRSGVTACDACHGDPDGDGPLAAPAQGGLILVEPSRRACGACHDDVDFTVGYDRNLQQMPPQPDDSGCWTCHTPDGGGSFSALAIRDAHTHPLNAPAQVGATFTDFTPFEGLRIEVESVAEAGAADGDGTLDPGEGVEVSFSIETDSGDPYPPARLGGLLAVLSGPTSNANLVLESAIPRALLVGPQPYTLRLPEQIQLELVGRSTASTGDVFSTARAPHLAVPGAPTSVRVRTGTAGGASTLAADSRAPSNFVDLADVTGFARDDFVVLDDGAAGAEEYLRIQLVDGNRLWFSSPSTPTYKPGTQHDHFAGATVREVQLTAKGANTFALNAQAGTLTEVAEFGAGNAVLVSYSTDFVVPARYPLAANASPLLDESWGKWSGMPLADGTYRLVLSGYAELDLNANGEDSFYRYASDTRAVEVLAGSADTLEPYGALDSGDACLACHRRLDHHDGTYRGFDACIACHGNSGAEDRPRYVAAAAPDTAAVTVAFRTLLHSVHRGRDLANAATFEVVGAGSGPYPDNFSTNRFDDVGFPARPGRSAECAKCHGQLGESWKSPPPRDHPAQPSGTARVWRATCSACHDSAAASAHVEEATPGGVEGCAKCHGPGAADEVARVHRSR